MRQLYGDKLTRSLLQFFDMLIRYALNKHTPITSSLQNWEWLIESGIAIVVANNCRWEIVLRRVERYRGWRRNYCVHLSQQIIGIEAFQFRVRVG